MINPDLFHFSYTHDLTLTLQRAILTQNLDMTLSLLQQHQETEQTQQLSPLLVRQNTLALLTTLSRSLYRELNISFLTEFTHYLLPALEQAITTQAIHQILTDGVLKLFYANSTSLDIKLCTEIKQIVTTHLDTPLTVEFISTTLGYSPSHLSRVFSSSQNKSLKTYILEEKLEHAKTLLLTTPLNLTEISEHLCFYRLDYFTYQFKRYTSLTPKQYRAQHFTPNKNSLSYQ